TIALVVAPLVALFEGSLTAPAGGSRDGTTVSFAFAARSAKTALVLHGSGRLTLPDTPARGIFQQAQTVQAVVTVRRGGLSARFTLSPSGTSYVFLTTIGVRVQEVRLSGRITSSTIRRVLTGL